MSETPDLNKLDPDVIVEERITPILVTCKGNHRFERVSGTEVKCAKCPLGYYLSPGMELKEGHIYIGKRLVI